MRLPQVVGVGISVPMLLMVTACTGEAPAQEARVLPVEPGKISCALPDGPVAIAASTHANAPALEVTPSVSTVLHHAVDTGQYLTLLDTDGSPSKVADLPLTSEAKNPQARRAEAATQLSRLSSGLIRSRANARDTDPLGAMVLAARTVRARDGHGTVVLMDSGLQTMGALRYQSEKFLLAGGQDVVEYLRSTGQLPRPARDDGGPEWDR